MWTSPTFAVGSWPPSSGSPLAVALGGRQDHPVVSRDQVPTSRA
jgi:hypothetical protein